MASPVWTFGEWCRSSVVPIIGLWRRSSNINVNCYFVPLPRPVSQRDSVTQPKVGAQRLSMN